MEEGIPEEDEPPGGEQAEPGHQGEEDGQAKPVAGEDWQGSVDTDGDVVSSRSLIHYSIYSN